MSGHPHEQLGFSELHEYAAAESKVHDAIVTGLQYLLAFLAGIVVGMLLVVWASIIGG